MGTTWRPGGILQSVPSKRTTAMVVESSPLPEPLRNVSKALRAARRGFTVHFPPGRGPAEGLALFPNMGELGPPPPER